MANYLISHYKGKYRIKVPYDLDTNTFSRKLDGTLEDIDCYIDCYNKIQIFSYGHGVLEAYIPSIGRGHNIVKAIKGEFGDNIIFDLVENDSEILFKFHAINMDKLEKYLKPKTSGASISPFSTKNLPKTKYIIPDDKMKIYKEIINKLDKKYIFKIAQITKEYIKKIDKKGKISSEMKSLNMKPIEYLCMINKIDDYLKFLKKEVDKYIL